jgi:micrococcal nuclease
MYEYRAQVISVYDGDTLRADIDLGFGVTMSNQSIRLRGIDAPEIRGESREAGLASRDYLRALIEGMVVTLKTHRDSKGKYGRWLGDVYLGDLYINDHMVLAKHALWY